MRRSSEWPEKYRITTGVMPSRKGDTFGLFIIARPNINVRIVACDGTETGWEHVSVSTRIQKPDGEIIDRTPPWEMMNMVKDLFWGDEECVVQFHPPKSVYVNHNPSVLHLWKKLGEHYETPPIILV